MKRRAREKQRGRGADASHGVRDERRVVLDALRLVQNQIPKVEPRREHGLLRGEHLVRRHEDVERAVDENLFFEAVTLRLGPVEGDRA